MSSRKVRVKKLNAKTPLPVLREDQLLEGEYDQLVTESQISTGVDQTEEKEYHLQSILRGAGTSNDQEIPVPPPQKSKINYNGLYNRHFIPPTNYIRFSQTVEESVGCTYDLCSEDADFLRSHNSKKPIDGRLSEDDFERVMEVFETTALEQTPFAAVDNTIVSYSMVLPLLNELGLAVLSHAKEVYEYWKQRRQEAGNRPLAPSLKYETHQEQDDANPYVCFRRREARLTRKTRGRDMQVAEKLKRLRRELEEGRQLVQFVEDRETLKRELLICERLIYEKRKKLRSLKIRMGIRGEDEELVNQKAIPRTETADVATTVRTSAQRTSVKAAASRSPDSDLVLLSDKLREQEMALRLDIETKCQHHQNWNQNHIDLTRGPLSPITQYGFENNFRQAKAQYLITPPASATSEVGSVDEADTPNAAVINSPPSPVQGNSSSSISNGAILAPLPTTNPFLKFPSLNTPPNLSGLLSPKRGPAPLIFSSSSMVSPSTPLSKPPSFRRRVGRLNRLWIDRQGVSSSQHQSEVDRSDQWKYDQDDETDEVETYEVDPFGLESLRFRASIASAAYTILRKPVDPQLQAQQQQGQPQIQASGANSARPLHVSVAK